MQVARALPASAVPAAVRAASDAPSATGELEILPRLYRGKEMVYLEDEPADFAYLVVEGAVRLHRTTPDGRRQLVGFAGPGDWLAVGAGEAYSHTAEALVESRLKPLSRAEFDRRMREDRGFLNEMMKTAASKLREAEEQMILLGQRSALEKVAAFLVGFARRRGVCGRGEFRLPMDRADIADYLGLTIETVSRKFTQLKVAGLIGLPTPSWVRIRDMSALERIAFEAGALQ